jgi:hypothetical protein
MDRDIVGCQIPKKWDYDEVPRINSLCLRDYAFFLGNKMEILFYHESLGVPILTDN